MPNTFDAAVYALKFAPPLHKSAPEVVRPSSEEAGPTILIVSLDKPINQPKSLSRGQSEILVNQPTLVCDICLIVL